MAATTFTPGQFFISLAEAIDMTRRFRDNLPSLLNKQYSGKDILPLAETFDKEAFRGFLDNENCKGIRIYLGMKDELTIHSVIVGVDSENRDMLPSSSIHSTSVAAEAFIDLTDDESIVENSVRCPPDCPPPSDLNSPTP